jgi:hypothetical protein
MKKLKQIIQESKYLKREFGDRWHNNSKMLKGRDKKLGQWEKKVKKSLDNLIKDYEKAWK